MRKILATSALTFIATTALAHGVLRSSVPADGDFVASPAEIKLVFVNAVQLTGAELKTVDGDPVDIGPVPNSIGSEFTIPVPAELLAGEYYLVWKCTAADSHFSTGEFFFTVKE